MNPYQLVCDIIKTEMGLASGQVYLFNEKFDIPADERLYVAVGVGMTKPISTKSELSGTNEVQAGTFQTQLQIEVMSRDDSALTRKEEVLLAFRSTYASNQQLKEGFGIFPHGNFINTSAIDGAAIPYRFSLTATLQYRVSKSKAAEYYDTFQDPEVKTES